MRDPHVEKLVYRFEPIADGSDRTTEWAPVAPVDWDTDDFEARLVDGRLTLTMRDHHASADQARQAVEPSLRAWEMAHALWAGQPEFRFVFEDAETIDLAPQREPGSPQTVEIGLASEVNLAGKLSLKVIRSTYPSPPTAFAVDPDVETLWHRWDGYQRGREQLQAMAYFCLTLLEMRGGGRQGAAAHYQIDRAVLSKLGELSTQAGDSRTARKMTPNLRDLSGEERAWMEAAVRALVRRAGELAAGASVKALTMNHLPQL